MQRGQPMEVGNRNEVAIVDASETLLRDAKYKHCGVSVDLYQFSYDRTRTWNNGHIFHGNRMEDLSFEGHINALDANNKRDAAFFVHETDCQHDVEAMMTRSSKVKDVGILRPYVVGYNTQISKVVSGFNAPTHTLAAWLAAQNPSPTSTPVTIPPEVQQLLRTSYQAMETIFAAGCTSDSLADPRSYFMVENRIQIDPLRVRDRIQGENLKLPRNAFGSMIRDHIYRIWQDDELLDFIFLLGLPKPWRNKILGAPVLLSPDRRELMYHEYDKAGLDGEKLNWLQAQVSLGGGWKTVARNEDLALKKIIDFQANRDTAGVGFSPDLKGALHFASVVTCHYEQHFKDTPQAQQGGVNMKNRVDWLLKKVLPRLLTRRYNVDHI